MSIRPMYLCYTITKTLYLVYFHMLFIKLIESLCIVRFCFRYLKASFYKERLYQISKANKVGDEIEFSQVLNFAFGSS